MRNTSAQVVERLVSAGLLDPAHTVEAESVVSRTLTESAAVTGRSVPGVGAPALAGGAKGRLVEIAGYVGGALVLAAAVLFVAQQWEQLSDTMQVTLLVTTSVLLGAAGLAFARLSRRAGVPAGDDVRGRLASALMTAGALVGALAVGRVVSLADDGFTSWPGLAGGLTMMALALAAYVVVPSSLGQLGMLGGAYVAALNGLMVLLGEGDMSSLWPGLAILGIGVVWLALAELGFFAETGVAQVLGAATAVLGAQMPLFDSDHANLAYALTAGVAVAGFVLYLRIVAWPYLVAGVVAVTLVVPEAVVDWTEGSLGPAGAVLVAGLALLGAAGAGMRVRKEATSETGEAGGSDAGDGAPGRSSEHLTPSA